MIVASSILNRAGESLGQSLPRIAGAILLLLLGLLVARIAGRITRRTLEALGADQHGDRLGVHDVLARAGLPRSLATLLGTAVRVGLTIVFIIAAVSLLGLAALSASLNQAILLLPRLFVAAVLIVAGLVIADLVRTRVDAFADRLALTAPIGPISGILVLAVFLVTALSQLHVPTGLLTVLVGIVLAAAALTIALAFGLGGRELATEISAGHEIASTFQLGQTIQTNDVNGEIIAFQRTATIIRTEHGETRIPHRLLLTSIVQIEQPAAENQ
jgi:small-conductance mechanosensitive channel